jgi:ribosomal protein S18 acetylase RimI-like enzyme
MIRFAHLDDIPFLKDLMIQLLTHHQEFNALYEIDFEHQHDIEVFFQEIISQENIHVFVAEVDDQIAGYLLCSKHIRPNFFTIKSKGRIDSLFVNPLFRKQNLAAQLLDKALDFLNDVNYIELEFTAENDLAKNFWLKKGFKILNNQCVLYLK